MHGYSLALFVGSFDVLSAAADILPGRARRAISRSERARSCVASIARLATLAGELPAQALPKGVNPSADCAYWDTELMGDLRLGHASLDVGMVDYLVHDIHLRDGASHLCSYQSRGHDCLDTVCGRTVSYRPRRQRLRPVPVSANIVLNLSCSVPCLRAPIVRNPTLESALQKPL